MTAAPAPARGARRALGVLLLFLLAAAVLLHHDLDPAMAGPAGLPGGTAARAMTMPAPVATGAEPAAQLGAAWAAPGRGGGAGAMHSTCGGSGEMCAAAGIAGQPLPDALPARVLAVEPPHGRGVLLRPPTANGPPRSGSAPPVLRI